MWNGNKKMNENYIDKIERILASKIKVDKPLMNLYVLLVLVKGTKVTLEDVHTAWASDKNMSCKEHYSLKPFSKLTKEMQDKDLEYVNAIRETAKKCLE